MNSIIEAQEEYYRCMPEKDKIKVELNTTFSIKPKSYYYFIEFETNVYRSPLIVKPVSKRTLIVHYRSYGKINIDSRSKFLI